MCGIAGIVDLGARFGRTRLDEIVTAMRDVMTYRGPDDAGVWVDPHARCALAHRRLSIIDLSPEGRQPMGNEDGSVQVTFNGEIYNFVELRQRLQSEGHTFRTRTDTEVLTHLFEGADVGRIGELDGMFAFGVWQSVTGKLILGRDPFGKKPLYYAQGPGWFAFASELHALLQVPGFDDTVDREALALYLMLQYVPAPWSLFRGARKLPPGCHLQLDATVGGTASLARYFRFEATEPSRLARPHVVTQVEQLKTLLIAGVEKRLVSDVPLGAFLSGGIDSSLIVALMTRELGRPVQTFSIGYQDTDETEHQFAREVADHLGTEHHEQLLKPDALGLIEHLAEVLDEPNGDSSCLPTYLLSKYTRRFVTVALSGDGGDELFGGYGRYTYTINEFGTWLERLKSRARGRTQPTPADRYLSPRWLIYQPEQVDMLMNGLPDGVRACIAGWRTQLNDESQPLIHRMRNLDVEFYMPGAVLAKVDRMSMQESLEVRSPLLDRGVAAFARELPAMSCWQPPAVAKYLLKELAARYLPATLIHRRKMGFGLPTQSWSRETMIAMANDVLLGESACLGSLLDRTALTKLVHAQSVPGQFSIYQLWPLLILELWLRAHRPNVSIRFADGASFSDQVRRGAMDKSIV